MEIRRIKLGHRSVQALAHAAIEHSSKSVGSWLAKLSRLKMPSLVPAGDFRLDVQPREQQSSLSTGCHLPNLLFDFSVVWRICFSFEIYLVSKILYQAFD